jgi:hypothetical protein
MKKLTIAFAFLAALSLPAFADRDDGKRWGDDGKRWGDDGKRWSDDGGHGVHGAPGPIAGAGLPVLALGYGAYWLVRRYRRKSDNASS